MFEILGNLPYTNISGKCCSVHTYMNLTIPTIMRIIVKSKAPPPIDPATIAVCDVDGAEIFQNDQIKLNNS